MRHECNHQQQTLGTSYAHLHKSPEKEILMSRSDHYSPHVSHKLCFYSLFHLSYFPVMINHPSWLHHLTIYGKLQLNVLTQYISEHKELNKTILKILVAT